MGADIENPDRADTKNIVYTTAAYVLFIKRRPLYIRYLILGYFVMFLCAVESISLIRFNWLTSLAPGS